MSTYNSQLNCIFIAVPRTGCGSISSLVGGGGHLPASIVKKRYPEQWDKAFKFAFVRDPIDRDWETAMKMQFSWEL